MGSIFRLRGGGEVKHLTWVCALAIVVLTSQTADSFNGSRKGFILGGGLGAAGTTFEQTVSGGGESITGESETKASVLTDFKIGLGTSEQFLLYYFNHVTWFSIENIFANDVTIANGVGGIGMTYFFKPAGPGAFIEGGLGLSTWALPFEDDADTWNGFGIWLGGGYEFSPHWMVEGTLGYGNPSESESGVKAETKASTIGVSVNYLGY